MTELELAPVSREDMEQLLELERLSFASPWTRGMFESEFDNPFAFIIGLWDGSRLVAYLDYWIMGDEAHVMTIGVHPDYRRRGLALRLMNEMVAAVRHARCAYVILEARVSNTPALALYSKLGFVRVGTRKKYYTDNGEDAVVMLLPIREKYDE